MPIGVRDGRRIAIVAVCCAAALVCVLLSWSRDLPLRGICIVSSLATGALLWVAVALSARGIGSISSLYVVLLWMFHFGLVASYAMGLPIQNAHFGRARIIWLEEPIAKEAILMATLGFLSCLIGVWVAGFKRLEGVGGATKDEPFARRLQTAGCWCVCASVLTWYALVLHRGGSSMLTTSYGDFLRSTEGLPLGFIYHALGVGMVFLAVDKATAPVVVGIVVFALWAVVAFTLGLRGEVLFPVAAAMAVFGFRRFRITAKMLLLGALVLCAISAGKEIRREGVAHVAMNPNDINPLNALAEMGFSLRPVVEVIRWEEDGEGLAYGSTYWAPIDRILYYVLPSWDRVTADRDMRIMSVLVQDRVGPIGFSPIAEAFHNFGAAGVVGIMALMGYIIGWLDERKNDTSFRRAAAGLVAFSLYIEVRNDFFFVPMYLASGIFVLLLLSMLPGCENRRHQSGNEPMGAAWNPKHRSFPQVKPWR